MPSVSRNINQVRRSLRNIEKKVRDATIKAAEDIALDLADKALNRAPKDTGELRQSADPTVEVKGSKINAKVTFSAKAPNGYDYALIQHEDLTFHHDIGENKYLEKPLKENTSKYKKYMDDKVGEALK